MKKKFKIFLIAAFIACVICTFIFYPFMCTDLHIKIYFAQDSAYTECSLYYTTTDAPNMSDDKLLYADMTSGKADLILSKELCSNLTGLRLDFTEAENLICINRIELCSGGFVRKTFDASQFFGEENIAATNDISSLQNADIITYIGIDGNDPYIMFDSNVVQECNDAYSHYTGTKAFICLFVVAAVLLARKKIYTL
ncbi:MAG: hypothetical protein IKA09_02330 [Lachnospiraceae bacterium]|nr:hypothetical protein [Lachnospiraceae bacterium]